MLAAHESPWSGRAARLLVAAVLLWAPLPAAAETVAQVFRRVTGSVVVVRAKGRDLVSQRSSCEADPVAAPGAAGDPARRPGHRPPPHRNCQAIPAMVKFPPNRDTAPTLPYSLTEL